MAPLLSGSDPANRFSGSATERSAYLPSGTASMLSF